GGILFMSHSADVLIIGGGAIGGAVALALAERGLSVLVVEAGRIGRGASWAAAGLLAADWSGHDPPELTRLAADSLAMWPSCAAGDLGVQFQIGTPVVALDRSGSRCRGVWLADGSNLSAGAVVVAAGAWSGVVAGSAGVDLPIVPWRGQMLSFDAEARPVKPM